MCIDSNDHHNRPVPVTLFALRLRSTCRFHQLWGPPRTLNSERLERCRFDHSRMKPIIPDHPVIGLVHSQRPCQRAKDPSDNISGLPCSKCRRSFADPKGLLQEMILRLMTNKEILVSLCNKLQIRPEWSFKCLPNTYAESPSSKDVVDFDEDQMAQALHPRKSPPKTFRAACSRGGIRISKRRRPRSLHNSPVF